MKKTKKKQDKIYSALEGIEIDHAVETVRPGPISTETTEIIIPAISSSSEPSESLSDKTSLVISVTNPSDLPNFSFVYIPPGTFTMGSPEQEAGRGKDEIVHGVTITKGFHLQTTPITQAQWESIMGFNPSHFTSKSGEHPVENISWYDCQGFIERLSSIGSHHYRLPTEAEWEYACRSGTLGSCAEGEIVELFCDPDLNLDVIGWYCGNAGRTTHPVAQKKPNPWGLYDMHGNVLEWCQDWYEQYGETKLQIVEGKCIVTTKSQTDPIGPRIGQDRVVRGGSWFSNARNCRAASRFCWPPNSKSNFIGFRLVRE